MSQDSPGDVDVGIEPAPPRATAFVRTVHREQLPRPVSIGAFAALILATLTRTPYVLFHGRFFAEEGYVFFTRMEKFPSVSSLGYVHLHAGYYNFFCNVATWMATRVPLARAPLVTGWLSWLLVVAVIWVAMLLPSELLPTPFTRIAAATLLIVGPVAVPEVWLTSISAQTYLGLLALLILFVELDAVRRAELVVIVAVLVAGVLSGPYAMLLAPLFVVQYFRRRTRRQAIVSGVVAVTGMIQLASVLYSRSSGQLAEGRLRFPGLGVLTRDLAAGHVSMFLFGGGTSERLHTHAYSFEGLLVFALLAAIVLGGLTVALLLVPRFHVAMFLIAAFVLEEALVNFGTIHTAAGGRYSVVPIGVLTLALVHATTARPPAVASASVIMCAVVLFGGLVNFWSYHPRVLRCINCPNWTAEVAKFHNGGPNQLTIWPYPHPSWHTTIPKSKR